MSGFLWTLLAVYVAFEAKAWAPEITNYIIRRAVRRLPRKLRPRYAEEWSAHSAETNSFAKSILDAIGFFMASRSMSPALQRRLSIRAATRREEVLVRGLDLVTGVSLIIFFLPILLPITLLNAVQGNPISRTFVIGRNGTIFAMYRFRTTTKSARGEPNGQTAFQRCLRRSSVDELPQLLNVVMGDMSLVGRRPTSAVNFRQADERSTKQVLRLKPGIAPPVYKADHQHGVRAIMKSHLLAFKSALITALFDK